MKREVVIGCVVLLFGMSLLPANGMTSSYGISVLVHSSFKLYVGGHGPGNYTTIQDAVDDAIDGCTVFVYAESSPYVEHVFVNRSIQLIGENRGTTIVDGSGVGDVMVLNADETLVSGFTFQHGGDTPKVDAGIEVRSDRDIIQGDILFQNGRYGVGVLLNGSTGTLVSDNLIIENGNEGIFIERSTETLVQDNVMTGNGHCAVVVSESQGNSIVRNNMTDNYAGVSLWPGAIGNEIAWNLIQGQQYSGIGLWPGADNNSIHDNLLVNNSLYGFIMTNANGNLITSNTIQGSGEGMSLFMANRTCVQGNNFIDNNRSAYFENASFTRWRQNYWDDHTGVLPKCIHGLMRIPWNKVKVIRWINFDWHPVRQPYDSPRTGRFA